MAFSNANFDGLLSTLVPRWLDSNFFDGITGNNALLKVLAESGKFTGGFGTKMVEALIFPVTTGPQVAAVTDSFATPSFTGMTGETAMEFTAAELLMPIGISKYELDQHGSATTKVNLVEGRMKNAMARFNEEINRQLWDIEEAANSGGNRNAIASIRTLVNGGTASTTDGGATPPALSTQVGNRAVASASTQTPIFNPGNIRRDVAGAAYHCSPLINSADTFSVKVLSKIYNACQRGSMSPNLILVHRDVMDSIQSLISVGGSSGGSFFTDSKLAKLGFQSVRFRDAIVAVDDRIPTVSYLNGASTAYGYNIFALNTDCFNMRCKDVKPEVVEHDVTAPIRAWTARFVGQITAEWLGRGAASRHVNVTP